MAENVLRCLYSHFRTLRLDQLQSPVFIVAGRALRRCGSADSICRLRSSVASGHSSISLRSLPQPIQNPDR